MMRSKEGVALLAGLGILFAAAGVLAHGGATGIVKQRMDHMETVGDAMKTLTAMMRGKLDYDAAEVRSLAGTIADHGGESLTELFPEGSLDKPTEALPAIWQDWDRFTDLARQLTDYATALVDAAGNDRPPVGSSGAMSGQGMMMGETPAGPSVEHLSRMPPDAAFQHMAQVCAACHQDFRKEK